MKAVIGLFALVGIPAGVIALFVWNGYFLSLVWGMVMVEHFGAPSMSVPLAIAVASVVGLLTNRSGGDEKKDENLKHMPVVMCLVHPPLCLLVVWLALKFV